MQLAMPAFRRGQKLAYSFDEDALTLAWDALAGQVPPGSGIKTSGFEQEIPAWLWQGLGLVPDPQGPWHLAYIPTTAGPSVALFRGDATEVESAARARLESAPQRPEAAWAQHRLARDLPDGEGDYPLGAYVTQTAHDAVLARRMKLEPGRVASWTTITAGAGPTEFARLQQAVGAYHVALVKTPSGATVGIWTGADAPATGQACRPVLRRLFRTQNAWRYGIKFSPA